MLLVDDARAGGQRDLRRAQALMNSPRAMTWAITHRVPAVLAGAAVALAAPNGARAGTVERVAVTQDVVAGVGVAAGRVYWATWDGTQSSVFARASGGSRQPVLH